MSSNRQQASASSKAKKRGSLCCRRAGRENPKLQSSEDDDKALPRSGCIVRTKVDNHTTTKNVVSRGGRSIDPLGTRGARRQGRLEALAKILHVRDAISNKTKQPAQYTGVYRRVLLANESERPSSLFYCEIMNSGQVTKRMLPDWTPPVVGPSTRARPCRCGGCCGRRTPPRTRRRWSRSCQSRCSHIGHRRSRS